jgi:coenzyme F420-0:L-glutamate ligase/coenzyme F420-1:gamma-L-glutamate ligase
MGDAWRADLRSDGLSEERITARIGRSDRLHRTAPELLAAFVDVTGAHHYPDMGRARAERDLFVLSGGSALEALLVALAARGLGSAWTSASAFAQETVREVLRLPSTWESIGLVAVGWPATPVTPRPEPDATGVLEER